MIKIYISGRYMSHANTSFERYEEISQNILKAEKVAIKLADMGVGFFCPHLHTAHFEVKSLAKEDFYIELDMDMLAQCQAIFMLGGWSRSKGANKELTWAIDHDMRVFGESDPGVYDEIKSWTEAYSS